MKKSYEKLNRTSEVSELKISKKNLEYIKKLEELNLSPYRLKKLRYNLWRFADLVEKDFDKLTREDSREASKIISNSKTMGITSREDIVSDVKRGMKFLFGQDEDYPEFIRPLKLSKDSTQKGVLRLPREMPDEKKIYSMIKACNNSRDKFFIALLGLDGGIRPVESFGMLWNDIQKDKYGYFITIRTAKQSGDKNTRVIRIIKSEPYFMKWSNDYPKEKQDSDFVFINLTNYKPMDNGSSHMVFQRLRKKLGIKERIYPYLLRHRVLTEMSKDPKVSIPLLKKFAGHSLRSNTIAEYQHFGDDDLKDMQLLHNGIVKNKEIKKEEERKPIICPKCSKSNEYDSEFCSFCNMALSQKRMVEINEILDKNNKMIFEQVKEMMSKIKM